MLQIQQNLNYLKIKSNWEWFNSIVKKIDFDTMLTIDYFDNTEQLINLNSEIRLPVFDFFLELKPNLNYINSNFVSSFIYPLLPCNQTTNTSEINSSHFEKKLVQTTNMLGQKNGFLSNITLFYYNDGTVEKKIIIK